MAKASNKISGISKGGKVPPAKFGTTTTLGQGFVAITGSQKTNLGKHHSAPNVAPKATAVVKNKNVIKGISK